VSSRGCAIDEIENTKLGYEDNSILAAFFQDVLSSKGTI
jgi:hypothetical protein